MSDELYKKYRPKTFKAVVGQEAMVKILKKMVETKKVPSSILFCGPSGTGKTTLARIVASKLGAEGLDLQEVNASSSRGIDDIRGIDRRMRTSPLKADGKKVWIIDECHKLSNDAQNAFLKPLEDTPSWVHFFLCTTSPGKLIATIPNRCTKIGLELLNDDDMQTLIQRVLAKESKTLSSEVLDKLIYASAGSPRRGLVLLGQILQLEDEEEQINAIVNTDTEKNGLDLARVIFNYKANWSDAARLLKEMKDEPEEVRRIILGYAQSILLSGGKLSSRAYLVIQAFRDHYYDCGKPGLTASCFEVMSSK